MQSDRENDSGKRRTSQSSAGGRKLKGNTGDRWKYKREQQNGEEKQHQHIEENGSSCWPKRKNSRDARRWKLRADNSG
jgi:hypothetical protein